VSVTVHILKHVKRVEEIGKYLLLEIEMMMGHEWEYIRVTACLLVVVGRFRPRRCTAGVSVLRSAMAAKMTAETQV